MTPRRLWPILRVPMELSDRQKRVSATAITVLSLVVILAALGALVWLVAAFFGKFSNVFLPLAVAGIVALATGLRRRDARLLRSARIYAGVVLAGSVLAIIAMERALITASRVFCSCCM